MSLEAKAIKIWMSPDEFELVVRLEDAISNRNVALDGRAEVELATLKEIFEQVHDPRLQKLTYKKRFESLANAVANQVMFHEKAIHGKTVLVNGTTKMKKSNDFCGWCGHRHHTNSCPEREKVIL